MSKRGLPGQSMTSRRICNPLPTRCFRLVPTWPRWTPRWTRLDHPELDYAALSQIVSAAVDRALAQLRATDPSTLLEERKIGRAGLPSTVIGCLFHGAEHSSRHAGQFISTVKLLQGRSS